MAVITTSLGWEVKGGLTRVLIQRGSLTLISTFGLPIIRLAIEADDLTVDDLTVDDLTVDDTAAGDVAAEQDGGLNQRGDDVYAMVACSREQVKSRATIQFEHPDGRRIPIRIPLGAETGDQLRVRNKGAPSELLGGEPGDLFLGLTLIETDR